MTDNTFASVLLRWFQENGRSLPWRETNDPYAIWLSEIILQQTRIEQGRPYWERFMRRWQKVENLAAASEDEVLREWQGLGYYSRARNLHFAARQIVEMGGFPRTLEGIRKLKGVGDYTAAAIASFAFGIPAAVVDGNVYRVLSRYFGISTPINTTEGKKEFAALAQELLPQSERSLQQHLPSLYNQAMMDFGATQCVPLSPDCQQCPLMDSCEAFRTGRVGQLPVKNKTLKVKTRHLTYLYIRWQGKTAIHRRGSGDIWQGLWEPVLLEDDGKALLSHDQVAHYKVLATVVRRNVKHVLTHRILLADFYLLDTDHQPILPEDYLWIDESQLDDYGKPRLFETMLAILMKNEE